MPNTTNIADSFHESMLRIITKNYEKPSISPTTWQSPNKDQQERLNRLKTALSVWEVDGILWTQIAYNEEGKPTEEYKDAIIRSIKETLISFRDILKHSVIFSIQEKQDKKGEYQYIMAVLKTPEDPQEIKEEELDINGLFYRDMTIILPIIRTES